MKGTVMTPRPATLPLRPDGPDPLSQLLSPVSPEEFWNEYWGKRHLFVHRNDPDHHRSIYSVRDVDETLLVARQLGDSLLTVIAAPKSGRSTHRVDLKTTSFRELYTLFAAGDSLRIMELERCSPSVDRLVVALREAFDAEATVGFYFTPRASQAFGAHFDCQENFILQIEGSKQWYIYEHRHPDPLDSSYVRGMNRDAPALDEETAPVREVATLRAGDLLYIPRGCYHKAVTSEDASLHLTVSIHPFYWVDLLRRTVALAAITNPELRRALPGAGRARPAEIEATLQRLLSRVLDHTSAEASLRSLALDRLQARTMLADGHFQSLVRIPNLALDDRLERRPGFTCAVAIGAEVATLTFNQHHLQMPAALAPALEFLASTHSFTPRELPGPLSDPSRLVLARRLVTEGLLRFADAW